MRSLTIISGVLMIATGVFCFINPGQTFLTMAFVVGTVMVICGVIHALAYLIGRFSEDIVEIAEVTEVTEGIGIGQVRDKSKKDNNGWILIDALLTLLLGILVLFNQITADLAIPMVFGMWVLVSGLLRIEAASRIDRINKRGNFKAAFVTGLVTTIIGLFGFVNPLVSWISIIVLLGLFMLVQGINSLELGINMPHTITALANRTAEKKENREKTRKERGKKEKKTKNNKKSQKGQSGDRKSKAKRPSTDSDDK